MADIEALSAAQRFELLFEATHVYAKIAAFPTARGFAAPKQDLEAVIAKLSSELRQQLNA